MRLSAGDPVPPEGWSSPQPAALDVDALYRSQMPRLKRFFTRRGAADDVLDLVQETFRRLLRVTADDAVSLECPEAYLARVADNLMRDRARSSAERAAIHQRPLDEDRVGGVDPHRLLEARDLTARVDAALATVKPKTRTIFLMHRLDGLSYVEIAQAQGMSVGGVEKQMAKALAAIRVRLARR